LDTQLKKLPGYSTELFNPNGTKAANGYMNASFARRASWLVRTFPYMEEQPLWDTWSTSFGRNPPAPPISGFTCPSNVPEVPGQPWLAYVGNAGWAFSDTTRGSDTSEHAANGIFFDDNKNPNIGPTDNREGHPRQQVALGALPDGTSKTWFLTENLHTFFWSYNAISTPNGYVQEDGAASAIKDCKHIFGFVWKNNPSTIERINGDKNYDQGTPPADMVAFSAQGYESYGFPSSNHPGGVNAAFGDVHVKFIAESLDPVIYGQLMTSNHSKSNLVRQSDNTPDRKLQQPSDDQY
jgi:hypothetical protein